MSKVFIFSADSVALVEAAASTDATISAAVMIFTTGLAMQTLPVAWKLHRALPFESATISHSALFLIPAQLPAPAGSLPEALADALADALVEALAEALPGALPGALAEALPEALAEALAEALVEALAEALFSALPHLPGAGFICARHSLNILAGMPGALQHTMAVLLPVACLVPSTNM